MNIHRLQLGGPPVPLVLQPGEVAFGIIRSHTGLEEDRQENILYTADINTRGGLAEGVPVGRPAAQQWYANDEVRAFRPGTIAVFTKMGGMLFWGVLSGELPAIGDCP